MTSKRQVSGFLRRSDRPKYRKGSRCITAWLRTAALAIAVLVSVAIVGSTGANPPQPTEEIVFRSERAGQPDLYLIGGDGSNFRRLTFTEARERTPRISPDGKWVAFSSNAAGNFDIWVVRREGGDLTRVSSNPEFEDNPVWLPDGRIVFVRGPFSCEATCATAVVVKRGGGQELTIPIGGIQSSSLDVTPDGTRIVFGRDGALYSAKLDGTAEVRVTSPPPGAFDFRPSYSPDATRIVFLRSPDGVNNELYVVNSDGSSPTQLTATPGRHEEYPSFSKDGEAILFMTFGNEDSRLRQMSPAGNGETLVSTDIKAPFLETFSRNGRDSSIWHEILFGTRSTDTWRCPSPPALRKAARST
jgi:Tol biopolymer transport system component